MPINRRRALLLATAAISTRPAKAGWGIFQDGINTSSGLLPGWQQLKVGPGGFVCGLSIANDGTKVCRCDTYGGYLFNTSTGLWTNIVNPNTLSPGFANGVYELVVAPSNSQYLYMLYNGFLYYSSNQGTTWTQSSTYPQLTLSHGDSNRGDTNTHLSSYRIAVDPNTPTTVLIGSNSGNAYYSTDGGVTCTALTAIGTSTSDGTVYPGFLFAFDTSSTIYAFVWGSGVYVTTTGITGTWTLTTGTPTTGLKLRVDKFHQAWLIDNTSTDPGAGTLWKLTSHSATWSSSFTSSANVQSVALDPSASSSATQQVVVIDSGGNPPGSGAAVFSQSSNGGSTWNLALSSASYQSNDVPWLAGFGLFPASIEFDPIVNGLMWMPHGVGVAWSNTNSGTSVTMNHSWNINSDGLTHVVDISANIEQLVARDICAPFGPGAIGPIVSCEDQGDFTILYANLNYLSQVKYPTSGSLHPATCIDWASNGQGYVAVAQYDISGVVENWGYSTNYGSTWNTFAVQPNIVAGGSAGGCFACSQPTTGSTSTTQIVALPGSGGAAVYSHDNGGSWHACTLSIGGALPVPNMGQFDVNHWLASDRVNTNVFYLYHPSNGLYKSTDGGVTWTAYSGAPTIGSGNQTVMLKCTIGVAGDMWLSGPNNNLYRLVDSTPTTLLGSVTATNFGAGGNLGIGAAKPGNTYPSIFTTNSAGTAILRSDDMGSTWNSIGFPPTFDNPSNINADPNFWNVAYYCTGGGSTGSGFWAFGG